MHTERLILFAKMSWFILLERVWDSGCQRSYGALVYRASIESINVPFQLRLLQLRMKCWKDLERFWRRSVNSEKLQKYFSTNMMQLLGVLRRRAAHLLRRLRFVFQVCSHFYGWKITQEFEHKFLGVWLKYPWICLEKPMNFSTNFPGRPVSWPIN